jgi:flagellin-like protein
MKKLLKNRKALSPVVAAIILIAVTVAVSIAVAAWMGALTFTFMKTESLEFPTSVTWGGTSGQAANNITLTVRNTGSVDLYLSICKVNGVDKTSTFNATATKPIKIGTGTQETLFIGTVGWSAGYNYEIRFIATSGTEFAKTFTAS